MMIGPTYAGMIVRVSDAATTWPAGKPKTDDMRDMIDHFERLGLINRVPCAYTLPGNILVVHPKVYAKMEKISR